MYKSALAGLAVLFLTSICFAGPQMDVIDNFCHFPRSSTDEETETRIGGCNPIVSIENIAGSLFAQGFARVSIYNIPSDFDSVISRLAELYEPPKQWWEKLRPKILMLYGGEMHEPCIMIDDRGGIYMTAEWTATISYRPSDGNVIYTLHCLDAQMYVDE